MSSIIPIIPMPAAPIATALEGDGMGCHSGGEAMLAALQPDLLGERFILDRLAAAAGADDSVTRLVRAAWTLQPDGIYIGRHIGLRDGIKY